MTAPTTGRLAVEAECPTCEGSRSAGEPGYTYMGHPEPGSYEACPDCMDEHGIPTGKLNVPAISLEAVYRIIDATGPDAIDEATGFAFGWNKGRDAIRSAIEQEAAQ